MNYKILRKELKFLKLELANESKLIELCTSKIFGNKDNPMTKK